MSGGETVRLEAKAFQAVVRKGTDDVVGYRYRWNDGSVQIFWLAGRVKDVVFADLPAGNTPHSEPS